jgi:hypothetical protein
MQSLEWGRLPVFRKHFVFVLLVGASLLASCHSAGHIVDTTGELTDEQKAYYEQVFQQYDLDHDGYITMEENLEQDRAIAEEQSKPFDEVSIHGRFG